MKKRFTEFGGSDNENNRETGDALEENGTLSDSGRDDETEDGANAGIPEGPEVKDEASSEENVEADGFTEDSGPEEAYDDYDHDETSGPYGGNVKPQNGYIAAGPSKKPRKKWSLPKKAIVFSSLAVVLAIVLGVLIYVYVILQNPMAQFQTAAEQVTATPVQTPVAVAPSVSASASDTPTPSVDPYDLLKQQADLSILQNTINILLIGVDYAPERDNWSGKHAYHSDVMIVCSINTKTNEVHLISLPRDTYAKIPGVKGIYKLNASIDCGGGWPTPAGFEEVCKAATWMLSGDSGIIPVQYYYAVDMTAVKGLVDAIGGVDFNIDIDYTMDGRPYKAGQQHMDGQAVLDYLRVRKEKDIDSNDTGELGDLNRINRQKTMLVAIFDKMKQTGLLAKLPEILNAFNGNLYTNVSLPQTAGLAYFCSNIDSSKVYMHSMEGSYAYGIFNWNFVITNQTKRVQLIKQVYGVDVKAESQYDMGSAQALWEDMQADVIVDKAKGVLAKAKKILDADAALPVYVPPSASPSEQPSTGPSEQPSNEQPATSPSQQSEQPSTGDQPQQPAAQNALNLSLRPALSGKGILPVAAASTSIPKGYRQYAETGSVWTVYRRANDNYTKLLGYKNMSTAALKDLNVQVKLDVGHLCDYLSLATPDFGVHYESSTNEVKVDFR
jgi:LCP family protein required for cell wall assembly